MAVVSFAAISDCSFAVIVSSEDLAVAVPSSSFSAVAPSVGLTAAAVSSGSFESSLLRILFSVETRFFSILLLPSLSVSVLSVSAFFFCPSFKIASALSLIIPYRRLCLQGRLHPAAAPIRLLRAFGMGEIFPGGWICVPRMTIQCVCATIMMSLQRKET